MNIYIVKTGTIEIDLTNETLTLRGFTFIHDGQFSVEEFVDKILHLNINLIHNHFVSPDYISELEAKNKTLEEEIKRLNNSNA